MMPKKTEEPQYRVKYDRTWAVTTTKQGATKKHVRASSARSWGQPLFDTSQYHTSSQDAELTQKFLLELMRDEARLADLGVREDVKIQAVATTAQAVFDTIAAAGESTAAGPPDSSAVALKAGPAAHLSSRQLTLGGQLPPLDQLRNLTVISITLTTPACALALKHCRWTGVLSSISITANFQWLQPVSGSDMAGALVPFEQVARRVCGGHGYSQLSDQPTGSTYPAQSATWEGDNSAMLLQLARLLLNGLLTAWAGQGRSTSSAGLIARAAADLVQRGLVRIPQIWLDPAVPTSAFRQGATRLYVAATQALAEASRGEVVFDGRPWNGNTVDLICLARLRCLLALHDHADELTRLRLPPLGQLDKLNFITIKLPTPACAAALEHCRFTGAFTELSISADFPWLTPMAEDEALLASRLADTYRSDLGVDLAVKMITMGLGLPGTAASDALMADARALFAEREAHELHPELRAALFGARMVEQHGSSALQGLLTAQAGSGRLVSSRGWMAGAATDPAQHYPVQSPWDWFPATWGRADPAFLSVVFRYTASQLCVAVRQALAEAVGGRPDRQRSCSRAALYEGQPWSRSSDRQICQASACCPHVQRHSADVLACTAAEVRYAAVRRQIAARAGGLEVHALDYHNTAADLLPLLEQACAHIFTGMPSMEVHEGTEAHRGQGALTHYIQNAIWNGDSNDMLLQTARYLVKRLLAAPAGPGDGAGSTAQATDELALRCPVQSPRDWLDPAVQSSVFRQRATTLCVAATQALAEASGSEVVLEGRPWNGNNVDLICLARPLCLLALHGTFADSVGQMAAEGSLDAPTVAALSRLGSLFGLRFIAREAGDLPEDGYMSGRQVRMALNRALGHKDGALYPALLAAAHRVPADLGPLPAEAHGNPVGRDQGSSNELPELQAVLSGMKAVGTARATSAQAVLNISAAAGLSAAAALPDSPAKAPGAGPAAHMGSRQPGSVPAELAQTWAPTGADNSPQLRQRAYQGLQDILDMLQGPRAVPRLPLFHGCLDMSSRASTVSAALALPPPPAAWALLVDPPAEPAVQIAADHTPVVPGELSKDGSAERTSDLQAFSAHHISADLAPQLPRDTLADVPAGRAAKLAAETAGHSAPQVPTDLAPEPPAEIPHDPPAEPAVQPTAQRAAEPAAEPGAELAAPFPAYAAPQVPADLGTHLPEGVPGVDAGIPAAERAAELAGQLAHDPAHQVLADPGPHLPGGVPGVQAEPAGEPAAEAAAAPAAEPVQLLAAMPMDMAAQLHAQLPGEPPAEEAPGALADVPDAHAEDAAGAQPAEVDADLSVSQGPQDPGRGRRAVPGAVASVTVAVAEAAVGMLGASALGYKKGAMLVCRGGLRLLRKAAGARSKAVAVA